MTEEERNTLDDDLRVRVSSSALDTFKNKSQSVYGKPYQLMMREIIDAFNSNRLRIIPTEEQKTIGELYNVN